MKASEIDVEFIKEMGFDTKVVDAGVKVFVRDVEVLIFPDADDDDQFGMQATAKGKELYFVWSGWGDLEDTFDEMLEEIRE